MPDSRAYTPAELVGHRIGITRPGPDYLVTVTDMETGLAISNVTSFLVTWDGHTLQASVLLDGSEVQVQVHHVYTVTDTPVEETEQGQQSASAELYLINPGYKLAPLPGGQVLTPPQELPQEQTPTSVPVSVPFSASEATSGLVPVSEVADGVPTEQKRNGDTEPELPVVAPEQEVQ